MHRGTYRITVPARGVNDWEVGFALGKVVFSGIQPTGEIHIGNYVGAIRNWVELQDKYDCLFCVVDYHAITVPYEAEQMASRTLEAVATNIAAGLDPEKSTIFVQSHVPEHTELAWLLNTITPLGNLERMTQFKDKSRRQEAGILSGLLNYPVLMAADILLYKASLVPVGDDQIQHLELSRDVARKFNHTFGELFPEPEPYITGGARIMALNDPTSKMSKSLEGSTIGLGDSPDEIRARVRRAVTDTGPDTGEMSPGVKNLFTLLEVFADPVVVTQFQQAYNEQNLRYSDLKQTLAEAIVEKLTPIRERRAELLASPAKLHEIIGAGADRARRIAQHTMLEVRELMGFLGVQR